jgi:hypothetical protein
MQLLHHTFLIDLFGVTRDHPPLFRPGKGVAMNLFMTPVLQGERFFNKDKPVWPVSSRMLQSSLPLRWVTLVMCNYEEYWGNLGQCRGGDIAEVTTNIQESSSCGTEFNRKLWGRYDRTCLHWRQHNQPKYGERKKKRAVSINHGVVRKVGHNISKKKKSRRQVRADVSLLSVWWVKGHGFAYDIPGWNRRKSNGNAMQQAYVKALKEVVEP